MMPTLIIKEHESREQQEKVSTSLCINNRKEALDTVRRRDTVQLNEEREIPVMIFY
jgi:hypothetical protein